MILCCNDVLDIQRIITIFARDILFEVMAVAIYLVRYYGIWGDGCYRSRSVCIGDWGSIGDAGRAACVLR
jgi:hypothetical protein